jgi:hypothetical protein
MTTRSARREAWCAGDGCFTSCRGSDQRIRIASGSDGRSLPPTSSRAGARGGVGCSRRASPLHICGRARSRFAPVRRRVPRTQVRQDRPRLERLRVAGPLLRSAGTQLMSAMFPSSILRMQERVGRRCACGSLLVISCVCRIATHYYIISIIVLLGAAGPAHPG